MRSVINFRCIASSNDCKSCTSSTKRPGPPVALGGRNEAGRPAAGGMRMSGNRMIIDDRQAVYDDARIHCIGARVGDFLSGVVASLPPHVNHPTRCGRSALGPHLHRVIDPGTGRTTPPNERVCAAGPATRPLPKPRRARTRSPGRCALRRYCHIPGTRRRSHRSVRSAWHGRPRGWRRRNQSRSLRFEVGTADAV